MDFPREQGICVTIAGDVQVCVPDDIQLMTPYVLQEQLDWFEDEIKFLRRLVQVGSHVVDIGANYGVYSLSLAKVAGATGSVTAFEPFPATAGWLRRSVEANGLENIRVIEAAVSDHTGRASMVASRNSELNRLAAPGEGVGGQPVALTTLDEAMRELAWPPIDFLKIDAEGHELSVIQGGQRFFEAQSPLVMLEIKAGDKVDLGALQRMDALGYSPYRLVPGLGFLAPFDHNEPIDGYQLNLFCCKPDRAQLLEQSGHLVSALAADIPNLEGDDWIEWLEQFPYGRQHTAIWKQQTAARPIQEWSAYRRALNAYARAYSTSETLTTRYACLRFAYRELVALLERAGNHPRLLSFIRISADLGQRQQAVGALRRMIEIMRSGTSIYAGEPFLPVSPDLEHADPAQNLANWIGASVLECYVRLGAFSSYFVPGDTAALVPMLAGLGFTTSAMERRLHLVRRRATPGIPS